LKTKKFKYKKISNLSKVKNDKDEQTTLTPKKERSESSNLSKRDVLLMSCLGFLLAVFILSMIGGLAYIAFFPADTTTIDLSGESEVNSQESILTTETIENSTVANETVSAELEVTADENITEEVEEETVDDTAEKDSVKEGDCSTKIEFSLGSSKDVNGNDVELKLVGSSSAQFSVDGKLEFMSVGDRATVSGLTFDLEDTDDSAQTADIYVVC
jgi:hypothetical protein